MADAHKNFAYTTVTAAPSPATSGTSMTVADGTVLPTVPFNATVWVTGANPLNSNAEIVRVTNNASGVLTILRAQEGSTARAIVAGDQFAATITAQTLTDAELTLSDGTNTQGSGTVRFSNSNGVSFGLNAGTLTASHNGLTTAALSNHSHGNPTLNLTNLTGTTASNSAGFTLSLSGPPAGLTTARASNDAIGLNTALTANGVAWTVNSSGLSLNIPAFLTTAAQSNHSHGNPQLNLTNISGTTASNSAGLTLSLSAAPAGLTTARASNDGIGLATAQSNVTWTVNSAGLSLDGRGYAGTGTSATNASVTLNSNGLAISVAAPGGGGNFSAGVSNVGNTAGQTGVTGTRLVFVGSQNITLNQATDANGATISISGGAGAAGNTGFISAGAATASLGTVVWSNSNGVSFGVNGQTVTASHNGLTSQSNQAVSGSNGSFTFQTVTFGNLNGVSFYTSNGSMVASHNGLTTARASNDAVGLNTAQTNVTWTVNSAGISLNAGAYLTTAMASNAVTLSNIRVSGGTTSNLLSALTFADSNGVSFGLNAGTLTATVRTDYLTTAALSNHSHGNPTLALTNLSGTTASNSAGLTLSLSAAAGGGGADGYNILAAGTQTATTAGTVLFENSNGVTFGMSGSTRITASHNGLTTARASNDGVGLATALTAGPLAWTVNSAGISLNAGSAAGTSSGFAGNLISGSMTHNTAGLNVSLNHPAWLTTAMQSNAVTLSNIRVSAGTTSNLLSALTFSNLNGISFGLNASTVTASHNGLTTAAASDHSHGNPTLALTNLTGTTASNSAGFTLSLSAAAPGGGGLTPVASASNGSFSFTTLAFSNANNVTFGTSAGSIVTASVAAPGAAAEQNAVNLLGANTAGNTTATGSTIGWSGLNLTLSGTNASQVVISAPATSSLSATGILSISTNGSTISIGVPAGTATMWQPFNEGVNVLGQQGQATMQLVPLPTPVPAALGELHVDRLVVPLYWSNSSNSTGTVTLSLSFGLYTKTASTLSLAMSTSYSTAWTFSGTASSATYNGIRLHTIPWTTTIGDGRYYVAQWIRSTTGGGNGTLSQVLVSQINSNFSGIFGVASNRSLQWPAGYGVYSASITTAMPSSVVFSQIDGTASLAARPPSFFMINGTV